MKEERKYVRQSSRVALMRESTLLGKLNAAAQKKDVNSLIRLNNYYRSAYLLERQAQEYRKIRNAEQLYVILMRYVSLVLETIPKHQEYRDGDPDMQILKKKASKALNELESLHRTLAKIDLKRVEAAPFKPRRDKDVVQMQAGHVPGLHWDGGDMRRGEIELGQEDVDSLDALGTPDWERAMDGGKMPAQGTRTESPVVIPDVRASRFGLPKPSQEFSNKHMVVPRVPSGGENAVTEIELNTDIMERISYPSPYAGHVPLGPQELGVQTMPMPTEPLPPGASCSHENVSFPPPASVKKMPMASTAPEKQEVGKRAQMRDVHISCALMDEFLRYAIANTRRGIETCGILAGSLSADDAAFSISALIIPKQEGTSDTVQALAEEEIFEAQDSRSLYPLGWVHTHPTQSCFLSSVDVHTQCGYQTMLDEAIAIVMAPTDMKTPVGIFRLTTPGGLKLIQNCPQRGFHAHPPTTTGQPIYDLCNHVYLNPRIGFEVIDLRKI